MLRQAKNLKMLSVGLILIVTFIAFLPSLKNDFVNWDDPQYTTENTSILKLSAKNIKTIFTSFYVGNYQPLAILTYSLEYNFFKLNPVAYHATNLILHLLNCMLVFWLIFLISKSNFIAFFTALFFGIHPMHVESVAWVSQRKDVLYALFYLCALISYVYYLNRDKQRKYYYICLILFIFSCLSKPMAVTLPFILMLFDYFGGRKFDKKTFLEKTPFIALMIIFGIITFFAQQSAGAIRYKFIFSFLQRIFIVTSSLVFHIFKILTPLKLSCVYPYPNVAISDLPSWFFICPFIILILTAAVIYSKKYTGKIIFGSLFFLISIIPTLQFFPFGNALAADRYTYIPSIGFFYLAAEFYIWLYARKIKYIAVLRACLIIFFAALIIIMGILTWRRTKIWKNSLILFEDVLRQYPGSYLAYNNKGIAYLDMKEYDKAINYFNAAVKLDRNNPYAYVNLCNANNLLGNSQAAIMLCKKAIMLDPCNVKAYYNLANAYADLGKNNMAIITYKKTISLKNDYSDAYHNLATIYVAEENYEEAINFFKKSIEINPDFAQGYYNLAIAYTYLKQFDMAVSYCDKAVSLGFKPEEDFLETLKPHRK